MSNGRKIFGFLKFVEDLKKFYSYLFNSSFDIITILKAFTTLSSCFYHFLDNLVWASNVGMIDRIITGNLNWKTSKNFFSLLKTMIKIVTNILNFNECMNNTWESLDKDIKNKNDEKILNETLKNRAKLRMITLNIIQSLIKLVTLFYSLKFDPFYSLLHPITVSLCGVIYCVISIFKLYYKNKDIQKKMLKNLKKSTENLSNNYSSTISQNNLPLNRFTKLKSFECSLLERQPNQRIIGDKNYFSNYYIDFNKDIPTVTENVLKANGGDLKIFS
jgi:hypothetical protein